jgi:flagellar motor switch protein FliN/FliY
MLIDQDEINALLSQADDLVEATGIAAEATPPPPPRNEPGLPVSADPKIRRLLRIRVPVIVQLARRPMAVSKIRSFAPGAILEFEKSVEEPLNLLINNRLVGHGNCVKVGENFGLRVTAITDSSHRIRSLGR